MRTFLFRPALLVAAVGFALLGFTPAAQASTPSSSHSAPTLINIQRAAPGTGTASPDTASGCNYLVCITVTGTGLHITQVYVHTLGDQCIPPDNFVQLRYGPTTREPVSWEYYVAPIPNSCQYGAYFNFTGSFHNGYYMCGTITDFPGEPCKQIKR